MSKAIEVTFGPDDDNKAYDLSTELQLAFEGAKVGATVKLLVKVSDSEAYDWIEIDAFRIEISDRPVAVVKKKTIRDAYIKPLFPEKDSEPFTPGAAQ